MKSGSGWRVGNPASFHLGGSFLWFERGRRRGFEGGDRRSLSACRKAITHLRLLCGPIDDPYTA